MNNEALKQFTNRIDELENRIDTIEEKKRKEGRGVWATTLRIGEIIGICGGFVALLMAATLDLPQRMKERIGKPNTVVKPGPQLDLSWREGKLDFNWQMILRNYGEGLDTVENWSASIIMPDELGNEESFNLENICALALERDRCVGTPLEVEARKGQRIVMSIGSGSKLTTQEKQAFLKPGLHRLILKLDFEAVGSETQPNRFINWLAYILKLDTKESQPKPPIKYCFWLRPETKDELVNKGHLGLPRPDPRC